MEALEGQRSLWENDHIRVDVRFSMYHGWEWTVTHRCDERWSVYDSGLARSPEAALADAGNALLGLAWAWDGF